MITYKQFLETTSFPSEEEFNNIIKELPSFDFADLQDSPVTFDPEYDDLTEWLLINGFLQSVNIYYYEDFDFNFDSKTITLRGGIENLETLNELNEKLISAGWTLTNYEEEKENLIELNSNRKKAIWWALHQDEVYLEDLEKLIQK